MIDTCLIRHTKKNHDYPTHAVFLLHGRGGTAEPMLHIFEALKEINNLVIFSLETEKEWYPLPNGIHDQSEAVNGLSKNLPKLREYISKTLFEHKIKLENTICLINMDGVGCGDRINALAARDFPALWDFFDRANDAYIHRQIRTSSFANLARPRLDAARFLWANIPSVSLSVSGAPSYYHIPKDDISTITPEILEDLAQLLFVVILDMADEDSLNFRN